MDNGPTVVVGVQHAMVESNRLRRIADRQRGLFTGAQAKACGYSPGQTRRRVAAGVWQRVIGQVFAYAGVVLAPVVRDRAAQLAVPGSVLAGPSAARLWGMPVPETGTYLAVDRNRHVALPGVRFLRTAIDRADLGLDGTASLTWRERTVFDCLLLLAEQEAADLLDTALSRGWISIESLAERVLLHVGRPGSRKLVRLLRGATAGARSVAERRLHRILLGAGIQGWDANRPIRDEAGLIGVGDVVFDALKLIIEIDGRAFHSTPERFQLDRTRQNRLVAAGWTVLRFTWRDLVERPDQVIATIRTMLARLSADSSR